MLWSIKGRGITLQESVGESEKKTRQEKYKLIRIAKYEKSLDKVVQTMEIFARYSSF